MKVTEEKQIEVYQNCGHQCMPNWWVKTCPCFMFRADSGKSHGDKTLKDIFGDAELDFPR